MKKFIKLTIYFVIIGLTVLFINYSRNCAIINKIYTLQNNFDIGSNYFIKVKAYSEIYDSVSELYMKDNTYLQRFIINDEITEINWHNMNTDEFISYEKDIDGELKLVEDKKQDNYNHLINALVALDKNFSKDEIKKRNLLNIIIVEDNCYKVKVDEDTCYYIDKETGVNVKALENSEINIEILFEKDIVTDDDINVTGIDF